MDQHTSGWNGEEAPNGLGDCKPVNIDFFLRFLWSFSGLLTDLLLIIINRREAQR